MKQWVLPAVFVKTSFAAIHGFNHHQDFVKRGDLRGMFDQEGSVPKILQFVDYYYDSHALDWSIALESAGSHVYACCLDVGWPWEGEVQTFKFDHPKVRLMLRVTEAMMRTGGRERLRAYTGCIDYLVFEEGILDGEQWIR